ncbi:MAG: hypothetical protein HYY40_11535 [Bacteroidetes bacterium]|nr:hypothetical protein [Bacteroidota bacterium]
MKPPARVKKFSGFYFLFLMTYGIPGGFSNGLAGDTLKPFYSVTRCGLNYAEGSVLLGKKMEPYGMPYDGVDQPAPLNISGIPASAKIEKAFIWWDLTKIDTIENIIVENPLGIKDTFAGQVISYKTGGCWGIGVTAFRANVTSAIAGNGIYKISGLPVDSTLTTYLDVNGATLLIIFSDPAEDYSGKIIIYDGHLMVKTDTVTQAITGMNVTAVSSYAEGFMIISDLENLSGNALKMNNGPYQSITADYWDFEKRSTIVLQGQTTSEFGLRVPLDCSNMIVTGLYYRQPTDTTPPGINRFSDTLICTGTSPYQWYLNGSLIPGATQQKFLATKPGIYSVTATNAGGCLVLSDTLFVQCLTQYKAPIYSSGPQFWSDNTFSSYQWYLDNIPISGAINTGYTATDTGYYRVVVTDTLGCVYYSDSVYTDLSGISEYRHNPESISVFPNPTNGFLTMSVNMTTGGLLDFRIFTVTGKLIYSEKIPNRKDVPVTRITDLRAYGNSIFFVEVLKDGLPVYRGKIMKF